MNSPTEIAAAFARVRERIVDAGGDGVTLLPVTKGFGVEAWREAVRNGAPVVGENYVQETVSKLGDVDGGDAPAVYFVGQLQTNKVRLLANRIARYESVDRTSLVAELAKRDPGAEILLQVTNTEPEPGKGGCPLAQVEALLENALGHGLQVAGLMTVGPTSADSVTIGRAFAAVRAAVDRLGLAVCSMGMTNDLELAVREGSTEVRIGSALFGERIYQGRTFEGS